MNRDLIMASLVTVLGATGLFLLLPHKHGRTRPQTAHIAGGVLSGIALLIYASFWSAPALKGQAPFVTSFFFYASALAAIGSGALMVVSRDPIHSALWFAAAVLATSGLFLLAGASFLAAGTIIVYAGAIIVTFLFVIMLAQMEGRALYDRAARTPLRVTWTCFLLFLGVLWSIFQIERPTNPVGSQEVAVASAIDGRLPTAARYTDHRIRPTGIPGNVQIVADRSVRPTARLTDDEGNPKPHVAGLGATIFTDHLLTVELAGALLFIALIGALAIAAPKPQPRQGMTPTNGTTTAAGA